jgi:hypothetical protein
MAERRQLQETIRRAEKFQIRHGWRPAADFVCKLIARLSNPVDADTQTCANPYRLYEPMIESGRKTLERSPSTRSALRVLFWLLAMLAVCGTPLGAGSGWAAAPDLAGSFGASEPHAFAKVESDKSYVEESKLLSFVSKSETGDDAVVAPPQGFPSAGDGRDCGPALPLLPVLQRELRSFDAQAPPARFPLA